MKIEISDDIQQRLAQFRPTELGADLASLSASEKKCLSLIVSAAQNMDELFLHQVYRGNPQLEKALQRQAGPLRQAALDYFQINFGPFDRLKELQSFLGRDFVRAPGATFYPEGMTKQEFDTYLGKHPQEREAFQSPFTVIRRQGKALVAVPYSQEYRRWLKPAAAQLQKAAQVCENPSLKTYLRSRADAFLSNDYRPSDMAWMDVKDNCIDLTIGPYEVYEDHLFGYKASFEAFVALRDPKASAELAALKEHLPQLEKNLPLPEALRGPARGLESPISVVNLVFTAGDAKRGVQTIAFNLPNDEQVRASKGSKKVLLANMIKAKFESILKPIAAQVLRADQLPLLQADAFVNHTLYHEISHGMGPGKIKGADGRETTVNLALRDTYSTLEEAKADITAIYNQFWMIDQGLAPKKLEGEMLATFLASIFRSVRFGTHEAHGKANLLLFNYLLKQGTFGCEAKENRFAVDLKKARAGVRQLVADLLLVEAKGDYAAASRMVAEYGQMRPEMSKAIASLAGVPVDIRPQYVALGQLLKK